MILSATAIEHLANTLRNFVCYYLGPLELVFLAIYHVAYLLPDGLLDTEGLFTSDGLGVTARLSIISFSLAVKCFEDGGFRLIKK